MDFPIVVAALKMKVSMHLKQFKPMIMMIKLNGLEKNSEHPAPTLEVKKNANAADVKMKNQKILLVNKHLQVAQLLCG